MTSTISSRPASIWNLEGQCILEFPQEEQEEDHQDSVAYGCCEGVFGLLWTTTVILAFVSGLAAGFCGSTGSCWSRREVQDVSNSVICPQPNVSGVGSIDPPSTSANLSIHSTISVAHPTQSPSIPPSGLSLGGDQISEHRDYSLGLFLAEYFQNKTKIAAEFVVLPSLQYSDVDPFHGIPAPQFRAHYSAKLVAHKDIVFSWDPLYHRQGSSVRCTVDGRAFPQQKLSSLAISPGPHRVDLWYSTQNAGPRVGLLGNLRPAAGGVDSWPQKLIRESPVLSKDYFLIHVKLFQPTSQYMNTTIQLLSSSDRPVVLLLTNSKPVHWVIDDRATQRRLAVFHGRDSVVTGVPNAAIFPTASTWPGRPADQIHAHFTLEQLVIE